MPKIRTRNLMALDNTLCVHVDSKGYVTSIRGHHGQTEVGTAYDIRKVVAENPDPSQKWRKRNA